MNQTTLEERTKRLLEVNEVVKQLDLSIRASAFSLLEEYIIGESAGPDELMTPKEHPSEDNRDAFFGAFNHEKPADNAILISAYLYNQYGSSPFTVEEIKAISNEVGITIPERIDMTFLKAQRDGKNLFQRAGRGTFRPTVHGEAFLKKTYNVTKGTRQKPV